MNKTLMHMMMVAGMLTSAGAQAVAIDGNLSDWGVQANSSASGWTPNADVLFSQEDQKGTGAFYLNPGWGGQAYDAEAMYMNWDSSNLYIGIATGHNPNTANNPAGNSYGAGDIAIDFGNNSSWDYGIELLGSGSTAKGHVYSNVSWAYGLWTTSGAYVGSPYGNSATADKAHPTSILSGSDIGSGAVAYTTTGQSGYGDKASDLHYFYEVSVPLATFGNNWNTGTQFNIHWTQNCANDSISVNGVIAPHDQTIPEPATLALMPLGLLGLIALRRRKSA